MTHGSLFAGIGGFDLGFERAGFKTVWQVEIEPFCLAVLATRFPKARRFDDIAKCGRRNLRPVDVITGGFPCQDLSVAGKRAGLAGARSGLFHQFVRVVDELAPAWLCVENVPGLFSSPSGRPGEDFAIVLKELTGFWPQVPAEGWRKAGVCAGPKRSAAWRVLDSRYFSVAQRRERVFIVCGPRIESAAAVLFESESGGGDSAESGEAGPDVARAIARGAVGSGYRYDPNGEDFVIAASLRAADGHHGRSSPRGDGCDNLVATLNSGGNDGGFRTEPGEHIVIQDVRGGTRDRTDHGQGIGIREGGPCYTLSKTEQHAVAFNIIGLAQEGRNHAYESERTGAIQHKGNAASGNEAGTVIACSPPGADGVRDFASLPEGLDSARYRALGNAVTVSVAEWIARRILSETMNAER